MKKRIEDLYQQYLLGQLSREDLAELQREVPQLTDDSLWDLMGDNFSLSSESAEMSGETQQRILQNLQHGIHIQQHPRRIYKFLRYASIVVVVLSVLGGAYFGL